MKKLGYFMLGLLLTMSCETGTINRPKKPKNLIKKEMMANIIYDMSIATAAKGVNKKRIEAKGISPESFIYEKYKIDSLQFALSNEYYSYDLDTYDAIYEKVKNRLEVEKKVFDSLIGIEVKARGEESKDQRKRRDSLKKIRLEEENKKTF